MTDEQPPVEYVSYNGLGRSPMLWGIPYMFGLSITAASLLLGLLLGTFVGSAGWLFSLGGVVLLLFVKVLCTNDDKAMEILLLEVKWTLLKALSGNAKFYGGTMTIAPMNYGRKAANVKRYFKKTVRR